MQNKKIPLKKGDMIILKPNAKAYLTYKKGMVPQRFCHPHHTWFIDAVLGNGWYNISTWRPVPGGYCSNVHKKHIVKVI